MSSSDDKQIDAVSELSSPSALDATAPEAGPSPGAQALRQRRARHSGPKGPRAATVLDRWLEALLGIVVIGSILAVGTVHVPVLLAVAALSIGTGLLGCFIHVRHYGRWPGSAPALVIVLLTAWTALQAIPMPASWLAHIAPANASVWAHAVAPLEEPGPAWTPLSLDPGASWVEVLKGLSYLGALTASLVIAKRRGSAFAIGLVFTSALCAGLLTIAHGLAGMSKVFGLYEPQNYFAPWHIGPLLNANHLAGYLNLGALCGLGVLLMHKPKVPGWVTALGVTTLVALTVASASRGAVVVLPVGVALFVLLLRQRPQRLASQRPLHWLALAVVGGGLCLALLGLTTSQWDELLTKDLRKLNILSWAKPLIWDHRWFGIGRGAFETVYPAYRPVPGHTVYTHPENILVQWSAEWGVGVALLTALFFLWMLQPRRLGANRSALSAGAWAGVVTLGLQNLVDFSLEIPSVALSTAVLLGALWGDSPRRGLPPEAAITIAPKDNSARLIPALTALALGGLFILGFAGWRGFHTASSDRQAFYKLSKEPPMSREQYAPRLRAALLRHPAEPYLPLMGALRAWYTRDENPVPYIQRTLERAQTYGRAHLLLADILFVREAPNQALMELRRAVSDDPELTTLVVATALRFSQDHEQLLRMVPAGTEGAPVLDTLGAWLRVPDPETGERFDKEALERDPTRLGPRERLAFALVSALGPNSSSPRCQSSQQRHQCAEQIEQHAQLLERVAPDTSRGARLRARALLALDRPEQAAQVLAPVCDHVQDRLVCLQERLQIAARLKDTPTSEQLAKQIAALGCADSQKCTQTYLWLGDTALAQGNIGEAVNSFARATKQNPSSAEAWERLGNAAALLGTHERASRAYERAAQLRPEDASLRERMQKESAKTLGAGLAHP